MNEISAKVLRNVLTIAERSAMESETETLQLFRAFVVKEEEKEQDWQKIKALMLKERILYRNLSQTYPNEWILFIETLDRDLVRVIDHNPNEDYIQKIADSYYEQSKILLPLKENESMNVIFGNHAPKKSD